MHCLTRTVRWARSREVQPHGTAKEWGPYWEEGVGEHKSTQRYWQAPPSLLFPHSKGPLCVHVCVNVYVCTCMYACECVFMYVCVCACICEHVCMVYMMISGRTVAMLSAHSWSELVFSSYLGTERNPGRAWQHCRMVCRDTVHGGICNNA